MRGVIGDAYSLFILFFFPQPLSLFQSGCFLILSDGPVGKGMPRDNSKSLCIRGVPLQLSSAPEINQPPSLNEGNKFVPVRLTDIFKVSEVKGGRERDTDIAICITIGSLTILGSRG
ncbi:hypothetical protein HOY80DRAFT_974059 [Tuber brumale]|nr:hypothetical protein HOY80DRAFT_974059 [Tuber brumale]